MISIFIRPAESLFVVNSSWKFPERERENFLQKGKREWYGGPSHVHHFHCWFANHSFNGFIVFLHRVGMSQSRFPLELNNTTRTGQGIIARESRLLGCRAFPRHHKSRKKVNLMRFSYEILRPIKSKVKVLRPVDEEECHLITMDLPMIRTMRMIIQKSFILLEKLQRRERDLLLRLFQANKENKENGYKCMLKLRPGMESESLLHSLWICVKKKNKKKKDFPLVHQQPRPAPSS